MARPSFLKPKRTAPPEEQFWVGGAPEVSPEHHRRVQEQIARLQERQQALMSETSAELEVLKQQLQEGAHMQAQVDQARRPLLQEIAELRAKLQAIQTDKQTLEQQLSQVEGAYQGQYTELQNSLIALKQLVRTQARTLDTQVNSFASQSSQSLELLVNATDGVNAQPLAVTAPVVRTQSQATVDLSDLVQAPALAHTAPVAIAEKPRKQPKPEREPKLKREKPPRSVGRTIKKLTIRTAMLALVVLGGSTWLKSIDKKNSEAAGVVAGVSTTTPITTSPEASTDSTANTTETKHKEAYAVVPFLETDWQTFSDTEFAISFRYPKNAGYLNRTPGGNNMWVERYDNYYIRISNEETPELLDQWWEKSRAFYTEGNTLTKGMFKNRAAWIVQPVEPTATSGTTYITTSKSGIMQIWVKDEDNGSDDGKRITKMIESFTFLN